MTDQEKPVGAGPRNTEATVAPPTSVVGILRQLGPGLIIAGSIVGSGELIATTATGAQAGFWLLWLIVIGCVIKVFVQVEFGRYSIAGGKTTMDGMNEVPGPVGEIVLSGRPGSPRARGNWLIWYWLAMFLVGLAQLGGIVGGVGQAMSITLPLTESGRRYNEAVAAKIKLVVKLHEEQSRANAAGPADEIDDRRGDDRRIELVRRRINDQQRRVEKLRPAARDDQIWAAIITVLTAAVLVVGRYGLIQSFATAMVATFTAVTIVNLLLLQTHPSWSVDWSDLVRGMSFRLTPAGEALGASPVTTALKTFGIIGVGATELIFYPYWCLEKGYARFTGPRDDSPQWAERARGWLRVMRWDAWCSMVVYTFATVAFYLLGAAVLGRIRLTPQGTELIHTLAVMYEPVFGAWAQLLFLFGAFAVLYSTFFVANASHARVCADAIRVFSGREQNERTRRFWVRVFCGLFPLLCLAIYVLYPRPTALVLASGFMQAMMLPMLAVAALYFRYRCCDDRIRPGPSWDVFLWVSAFGMLVAGAWLGYLALASLLPA